MNHQGVHHQRQARAVQGHELIEREQALLIAQDQVVCALRVVVVNADAVLALELLLGLRLDGVALLVHREVAGVHRARLESPEVLRVRGIEDVILRGVLQSVGDDGLVLLLEDLAVARGLAVAGEVAVLRHLVDEEKAQALDAAAEQRLLLFAGGSGSSRVSVCAACRRQRSRRRPRRCRCVRRLR